MKQLIQNFRTGELTVDEVPAPVVKAGGVLVANAFSLISADIDMSALSIANKGLIDKTADRSEQVRKVLSKVKQDGLVDTMKMVMSGLNSPAALGYSCAGIVLEAGRAVDGFCAGTRVACAGQNYASHAEHVYVPKNLCVPVPDGVSLEEASYVTLGAVALQGIRQAEPGLGDVVAVIGLGLLGQLTIQMLKANGCVVIAADVNESRLALAREFGIDYAITPDKLEETAAVVSRGQGVDSVIITASTKSDDPVTVAGEICRKKGKVVVVGTVGMKIPRESYYVKELDVRLSASYGPGCFDSEYEEKGIDYPYGYVRWTEKRNMEAFLKLIEIGKVNVSRLISHTYFIEEAQVAYKRVMDNSEPLLGILLEYNQQAIPVSSRRIALHEVKTAHKIKLGLLGGGRHVKDILIPALSKLDDLKIVAACTGSGLNAKSLGQKTQAEYCTSDYREVLADQSINAVLIGTWHNVHAQMVIDSLQAGKHVFVEKPLCISEPELVKIIEVYEQTGKSGTQIMAGFNRRFSSHALKAKEFFGKRNNPLVMNYRVNAGAIDVAHWTQDPEVGGGRLIGEGCHYIDYMTALAGAVPVSVYAQSIGKHSTGITSDQIIVSLEFADGSVGNLVYVAGGDLSLAKERFEAHGDGKSLVMDDFMLTEMYSDGHKNSYKTSKRDMGFAQEIKAFSDMVLNPSTLTLSFAEISSVTRATLLATQSLSDGQPYQVIQE